MKRELVAVLLLAVLLALSIINVRHIENKAAALSTEIEEAYVLYQNGDREGAAARVEDSLNSWLSWESYSHIMLRHSEIDVITGAYYMLLEDLEGEDTVSKASFNALEETLNDIVKKERIRIGSLL